MRPTIRLSSREVVRWLDAGRDVAAGTLIAVEGSAPLESGAVMYVTAPSTVEGSITGGCVESAVAAEALALLESHGRARVLKFGITDELAGTAGLMCGGTVHILVHEISRSPAARLALMTDVEAKPFAVATVLDGDHMGAQLTVTEDVHVGSLGNELLDRNVTREGRALFAHGRTTIRRFGADGATLGEEVRVHIASRASPPRMVLVGAVDFAAAVIPLATAVGYEIKLADPRGAFLESPRYSLVERVKDWPEKIIDGMGLEHRDVVVVCSHDARLDVPALQAALASDAGYIGALGSRRTTADRTRRLREAGATDQDISRLHSPCGLDIGSATPEETAVSILAEIIAARTGRSGTPLRDSRGTIRQPGG